MNTVLLCGPEKETDTTNVLLSAIRGANAGALLITAKTVMLLPPDAANPQFVILDNANLQSFKMKRGIAVFKKGMSGSFEYEFPEGMIAVVDTENKEAISVVQKYTIQTVTCGLSKKDTVTFSSLDSGRAVVSLQRELPAIDGQSIYPREIPVTFTAEYGEYPLLAAMAVLLLSGISLPDKGINI